MLWGTSRIHRGDKICWPIRSIHTIRRRWSVCADSKSNIRAKIELLWTILFIKWLHDDRTAPKCFCFCISATVFLYSWYFVFIWSLFDLWSYYSLNILSNSLQVFLLILMYLVLLSLRRGPFLVKSSDTVSINKIWGLFPLWNLIHLNLIPLNINSRHDIFFVLHHCPHHKIWCNFPGTNSL